MAKDFNKEPEEMEDVFIDSEYNPLSEAINEKPYTKPNVTINPEDLKGEIPEPDFTPPPMDSQDDPFEEEIKVSPKKSQNAPRPERRPPPSPMNPELEGATKKEFKKSARVLAEMGFSGYELLHKVINGTLKFSENKIQKLVAEDKISLSMRLPYDEYGNTMSVNELIQEYNEQTQNTLTVDPEWKEETMPVLIEVLEKRGIGATPEQQLLFLVAKDVGVKTMIVASALSAKKSMINTWTMLYEQNKMNGQSFNQNSGQVGGQKGGQEKTSETYETVLEPEEYNPLGEEMTMQEFEEDTLSVNHQVEKMTNPDAFQNNGRKRGRPKKG